MAFNKIFGLGFHKTGVTSLAMALSLLGYHTNKGLFSIQDKLGRARILELLKKGNYQPFFDFMIDYDATLDNPWYILYKELDKAFPNSKFILTIRDDEQWLTSCKHFFKGRKNDIHNIIYGVNQFEGNEEIYLQKYKKHIEDVNAYFKDRPEDLLIVNWENGSGWNELCPFLNKNTINIPFPHLNSKT